MKIEFDRSLAKGRYSFAIIVTLLILLIPFGAFLLHNCFLTIFSMGSFLEGDSIDKLMSTYETYLNPSFDEWYGPERGYKLVVAYAGAFLLNGILVSLVVSWIQNRRERWERGDLHYSESALGEFCIVIGGNAMVPDLVKQLLERNDNPLDHVLVMTNRDVASLRKVFASKIGKQEEKVVIYYGERTSKDDLMLLRLEHAADIYVIGEQLDIEQSGSHHDVKNMECVRLLANILHQNPVFLDGESKIAKQDKKPCRVMFEYQSSFSVFQFTDINSDIASVLDFKPFNYYETWAQNVFVCPYLTPDIGQAKYFPLEGNEPITADSECTVHLIIVGMSRMGVAMAIEAAQIAHYPNFLSNENKMLRTRITFIDSTAHKEMQYFQGHYKELFAVSRWRYISAKDKSIYYEGGDSLDNDKDNPWQDPLHDENSQSPYRVRDGYTLGEKIVDMEWEFIQGELEMPSVQHFISDVTTRKNERLTIAVCIPKDNASFAASLYLPDEVFEENSNVVQVLVYQPYGDAMCVNFKDRIEMAGMAVSIQPYNFNQFAKLRAFGMMSSCYNIKHQQKMELAAQELWNQYDKTYKGRIGGRKDLRAALSGVTPLKAGKSLAARQWSNTYAAAHLWTKLRSVSWSGIGTIDEKSRDVLAKLEHIRWNMEQLLLGYAPLRQDEQKGLYEKLNQAMSLEVPNDEILQLNAIEKEAINKDQFRKLQKWLDAWEGYDNEREILKANMSHIDICSFETLEKIDKEAIKYDEDMTGILPQIYAHITQIND